MIRTNKKSLRKIIREEYLKILVENEKRSLNEDEMLRRGHWDDLNDLDDYLNTIGQNPEEMAVPGEDKPWLYGAEKPMEDPLMRSEEDILSKEQEPWKEEDDYWERIYPSEEDEEEEVMGWTRLP